MAGRIGARILVADPKAYQFKERLDASQAETSNGNIRSILVGNVSGALDAKMAHKTNDRDGIDWWIECVGARFLGVDCKVRDEDWAAKPKGIRQDDVALETWSVIEKGVIGWTRNDRKRADYILWLWKDTGRWMLVPFPMLCRIFSDNWCAWKRLYKTSRQYTEDRNYHSECVFVPRKILWERIYSRFGGRPNAKP